MCVPGCHETIMKRLSRRSFFKQAAAVGAASAIGCASGPSIRPAASALETKTPKSFSEVVDLTHQLGEDFLGWDGSQVVHRKNLMTIKKSGLLYMNEWRTVEHVGTHIDAPIHFSENGLPVNEIPISKLVAPLAVVDIRSKSSSNDNAQLTPDDIKAYEAEYGEIPENACVAMLSGWDAHVTSKKFRNEDSKGVMHFPGFHVESVKFLLEQRSVVGIAVDTMSLDYGQSKDFASHVAWLPTNRWGLENVANLGTLPPSGATIVVGAPVWKQASGGPSRVMALL